jgi:hypothetical protein
VKYKIISKDVSEWVWQQYIYTVLELYGERHPWLLGCTKEEATTEAQQVFEDLASSRFPNSESVAEEFIQHWMRKLLEIGPNIPQGGLWKIITEDANERAKRIRCRSIDDAWRVVT